MRNSEQSPQHSNTPPAFFTDKEGNRVPLSQLSFIKGRTTPQQEPQATPSAPETTPITVVHVEPVVREEDIDTRSIPTEFVNITSETQLPFDEVEGLEAVWQSRKPVSKETFKEFETYDNELRSKITAADSILDDVETASVSIHEGKLIAATDKKAEIIAAAELEIESQTSAAHYVVARIVAQLDENVETIKDMANAGISDMDNRVQAAGQRLIETNHLSAFLKSEIIATVHAQTIHEAERTRTFNILNNLLKDRAKKEQELISVNEDLHRDRARSNGLDFLVNGEDGTAQRLNDLEVKVYNERTRIATIKASRQATEEFAYDANNDSDNSDAGMSSGMYDSLRSKYYMTADSDELITLRDKIEALSAEHVTKSRDLKATRERIAGFTNKIAEIEQRLAEIPNLITIVHDQLGVLQQQAQVLSAQAEYLMNATKGTQALALGTSVEVEYTNLPPQAKALSDAIQVERAIISGQPVKSYTDNFPSRRFELEGSIPMTAPGTGEPIELTADVDDEVTKRAAMAKQFEEDSALAESFPTNAITAKFKKGWLKRGGVTNIFRNTNN